ncbi:hypothetical protein OG689_00285 [Kitasatospora sp. NBC_00240]|uniref:hypothetical protein n=1 Tax=Kitasatospora sp. NBC_00240 TaxID=2903567 RepID=UPI0022521EB7|nr:hypothetical protein [Kitasatospora sp. NBC_00240]MCX5207770.1 hypothetical protein [Kitasatospora sp. NBC_00240]
MTQRILVTGAAGGLATLVRPLLACPGRVLRLLDIAPIPAPGPAEETVQASVADLDALRTACTQVDAVVHLGGLSTEHPGEQILDVNIKRHLLGAGGGEARRGTASAAREQQPRGRLPP